MNRSIKEVRPEATTGEERWGQGLKRGLNCIRTELQTYNIVSRLGKMFASWAGEIPCVEGLIVPYPTRIGRGWREQLLCRAQDAQFLCCRSWREIQKSVRGLGQLQIDPLDQTLARRLGLAGWRSIERMHTG